ncbi:MAG TPA: hypothetical protein VFJ88_00895 [Chthoniobacterales bacterium]|jgi:hypothetical protein|nr:hypothetical protein [Chthoniobacterales bacterium]
MLEAPTRNRWAALCLTAAFGLSAATLLSSCATEHPQTALIDDPDSHQESSIPWNRPQKWENGSAFPGGNIGGIGGGPGAGLDPTGSY